MLIELSIVVASVAAQTAALSCDGGPPTGFYEGTVVSQQAGNLEVTLNLRCSAGSFAGAMVTPVGTLGIRDATYSNNLLIIHFDYAGSTGVIRTSFARDSLTGTFAVSGDSGRVALTRVTDARPRDVPTSTLSVSSSQWRDDIKYFAREIPRRHANAFAHYPRAQFESDVAALDRSLDHLNPDQIYVRLDAIANRIGDGHTFVAMPGEDPYFPLVFKQFGSDYRLVAASPEYARALGARLVRIDSVGASTAHKRLLELTPVAETMALRDARVEDFLTMGEMLHGFGITVDRTTARYAFINDSGTAFAIDVRAIAMSDADSVKWRYVFPSTPLTSRHADESFWYTYLPDAKLVYCNWRGYDKLSEHAAGLFALIDSVKPERILIDMRQNGGGDFNVGWKFIIEPIARRPELNRSDRLFVAIGTNTFSAGMSNSVQFRTLTHATLVGTPIGERPNSYQEAREMHLPNSWLMVQYSTKFYHFLEHGPNELRPDVTITTSWGEYKAGRDPVLERFRKDN